jgi:intergrase/recombinase
MAKTSKKVDERVLRFTLSTTGPHRSEKELARDVKAAQKEALAEVRKRGVTVEAEPEGGFLGAGAEWVWLLHVAQPYLQKMVEAAFATAAAETTKDIYRHFKTALLKRNIIASDNAEEIRRTSKKSAAERKKGPRKGKR